MTALPFLKLSVSSQSDQACKVQELFVVAFKKCYPAFHDGFLMSALSDFGLVTKTLTFDHFLELCFSKKEMTKLG